MSFFKVLRIAILLTVLVIVAGNQFLTQSRISSWEKPIWMTVYPILAGEASSTLPYLESLRPDSFSDIGGFLTRQAGAYGNSLNTQLKIQIAPVLTQLPPPVPIESSRFSIAIWSLKMRWWAWRRDREDGLPSGHVQMFILYRETGSGVLMERSVGMQKGMYGIVSAKASRAFASRNRVIVAHELLHILGATDKYEPGSGQPIIPDGLANPDLKPLYPQSKAEIMAGHIALSSSHAKMPASLKQCVIGPKTALEIGW
jgi:hypothetical protein